MLRKERAAYIQNRLQQLYPETPIPLDHKIPTRFSLRSYFRLSARIYGSIKSHLCSFSRGFAQEMVKLSVEEIRKSSVRAGFRREV